MRRSFRTLPLLLLLFTAAGQQGCSRAREREDTAAAILAPTLPASTTAAVPIVDVPAEIGRSIDEVRQRLGPPQPLPAGFEDPAGRAGGDSTLAFRPRGLTVVASYNAQNRRVLDLLVLGPDEDVLMHRAGLAMGAPAYLLLPVFTAGHFNRLLGLRVVPRC